MYMTFPGILPATECVFQLECFSAVAVKKASCLSSAYYSLVPRFLCREEEREPGTHCLRMHQVLLVTSILLHYTKIMVTFFLPAERPYCMVTLSVGHIRAGLKVKNNIALMVKICITSLRQSVNFKVSCYRPCTHSISTSLFFSYSSKKLCVALELFNAHFQQQD